VIHRAVGELPPRRRAPGGSVAARRLAEGEDELAAQDVGVVDQLEPVTLGAGRQARLRVVGDVLVLVAAGSEEPVERLDHPPSDGRIVGRPEHEQAARPEHPDELGEDGRVLRNVLDHLRADHAVERRVAEGERGEGGADQRDVVAAHVAELVLLDVQPHRVVEALEDDAGAASDVERPSAASREVGDDAMPPPLPVPLEGNLAVEGPLVVVGRIDRVPQRPEAGERTEQRQPEAEDPGVRGAVVPRIVRERDLHHVPPGRVRLDQDLLQHVEVPPPGVELREQRRAVEAEAAGQVSHRQAEPDGEETVEDAAEELAVQRHVGHARLHVPRGDHDVGAAAGPPELRDEVGIVGEIGVERDDVLAAGRRESLAQGAAIPRRVLQEHSRTEASRQLRRAVARSAVDDQHLAGALELLQHHVQPGKERGHVLALVQDRNDDREIQG